MKEFNYYLIPGMGANHRIYTGFRLKYGQVHFLDWVDHRHSKNLTDYAHIMAERVTTENNILIGSSMGGMMAVEMSRIIKPDLTVLVSAPTGRHQFPTILKTAGASRFHRIVPVAAVPYFYKLADTFMGFKTDAQRAMFYEMLTGLGPRFVHFSVKAVLEWANTEDPEGRFIQIVGDQDKLFDHRKMANPLVVQGGGHFSAFEKGSEISEMINEFIRKEFGEK